MIKQQLLAIPRLCFCLNLISLHLSLVLCVLLSAPQTAAIAINSPELLSADVSGADAALVFQSKNILLAAASSPLGSPTAKPQFVF